MRHLNSILIWELQTLLRSKKTKGKGKDKKNNILNVLNNLESVFTGTYLLYKVVPKEAMLERSIEERTKLKRGRWMKLKGKNRT